MQSASIHITLVRGVTTRIRRKMFVVWMVVSHTTITVYMAAEQEGEMNYPELTPPLRVLTRRKTKFSWTEVHQKYFELIKERLCSDRVMVPFDPERDTRLYSDGGPEGGQATVAQAHQHETEGTQWRSVANTA